MLIIKGKIITDKCDRGTGPVTSVSCIWNCSKELPRTWFALAIFGKMQTCKNIKPRPVKDCPLFLPKDGAVGKDGFTQDIIQGFEHLKCIWFMLLFVGF
jgi:hypothetical protein